MKVRSLLVCFDNGGGILLQGILLQTARFCYSYEDPKQAAVDVRAILAGDDPAMWDGNQPEFRIKDLASHAAKHYCSLYSLLDLRAAVASIEPIKVSGYAETEFLRELTGRKHIDDEFAS